VNYNLTDTMTPTEAFNETITGLETFVFWILLSVGAMFVVQLGLVLQIRKLNSQIEQVEENVR